MQALEAAAAACFEDEATQFNASRRYVSVLQSHRGDEEISRNHRSQRRSRYVIGLTDSYRKESDEARNRLLKEKSTMRSQKEFSMLSQLAEITKWHEVIRANAQSRQQVRDQNEVAQKEMHEAHLETLKEHLLNTAEHQKEDDTKRWRALVEKRKADKEHEINNLCRELVEEAVDRAGDIIQYAENHDLPLPLTQSIPSVLVESWQREHIASEEERQKKLMQAHVSLELYGYHSNGRDKQHPHNPAVVSMLCKALNTLRPPAPPSRPANPQPWPLIFITGPRYSGKSVIAESVANHLGMLYFSDQSLVSAAIEELQQDFTSEDLSDPIKAELVDLGHSLQKALLEGGPVPVEAMAQLIGHCVKTAPEDCKGMLIDGLHMTIEAVKAIEAILSGYHDPVEEEALLLAPQSASDPTAFSTSLSVYRPQTAVVEITATQSREKTKGGAKKKKDEDEPLPPIDIPPLFTIDPLNEEEEAILGTYTSRANVFGIARIVYVECDADQLFDRVAKVRFDAETGEEYHLDFNPPPDDRLAFLQIRDRPEQDCGNMFAQIEGFAANWEPTERWLQSLVHKGIAAGTASLTTTLPSSGDLTEMVDAFQDIAIAAAEERRLFCHAVEEARRITAHREELAVQQREHNRRRDAVKRQLLTVYTERQVDPMPAILMEPDWESTQPVEMTSTLANVLLDTLTEFTANYTQTVTQSHDTLNSILTAFHEHNDHCAARFELFWKQDDNRQEILSNFLQKDLILDRDTYVLTAAKEEMHYRIDTLQAALWRTVDARRAEATALIEQLCSKTTIVEAVNEAIRGLGAGLVQCELDRFLMVRHLVLTYFSALQDAPAPLDLTDVLPSEVIPQLKGGIASEKDAEAAPAGKGAAAKKAPPKKGKNAVVSEDTDRPQEDMLIVVKAKAVQLMETLLDKLTIVAQAPSVAKAKKGAVEVTRADANAPGAMATPIVEREMETADLRMQVVVDYFNGIADNVVVAQTARLFDKLAASLHTHYLAQLAAVNAAISYLRNCVEREVPPQYQLTLELERFVEDVDTPLHPPAAEEKEEGEGEEGEEVESVADSDEGVVVVEEEEEAESTPLTSSLNLNRAHYMIALFRVCAPDYRLHKADFVRIVKESDYECAAEEVASVPDLFDRFDDWGTGIIDWRLFIVHLLFWCEPLNATAKAFAKKKKDGGDAADGEGDDADEHDDVSSFTDSEGPFSQGGGGGNGPVRRNKFYVDGPDFMSLLEMRADLGDDAIEGEESFVNADHFFGSSMPEESDEDRFSSYCSVIWATFAVEERLDPQTFIMFLCPDEQPIRGLQKAFGVVSSAAADENCALTPDLFDKVFHIFANNPRALGVLDPCSVTAQQDIYDAIGATAIQFQDFCGIHAGRVILNNSKCFQRKLFAK